MGGVEHIAARSEDCVSKLLALGVELDAIVCDMNCHPRMSVDAVLALLPIARSCATIVVTLKKVVSKSQMDHAVEIEISRLRDVCGSSLQVLHLFIGGADERTLVGTLSACAVSTA